MVYSMLAQYDPADSALTTLARMADRRLAGHPHGDLPRWHAALQGMPRVETCADLNRPSPVLGAAVSDPVALSDSLMRLHPWRKGPLTLGGVQIDAEWRSDLKWDRVAGHVDLRGARVLDIGCGNGYFGLRMLAAGAELVVGIDPTLLFVMQYLACRRFGGDLPNFVLPLGIEDLPEARSAWDAVFSMGVLYHRKDPVGHLRRCRGLLKSGSTLVLETLVLPRSRREDLLIPDGRYARMRNVWAIPGTDHLLGWVKEAGLRNARLVDVSPTTTAEQRSTPWMRFESLEQALAPGNGSLTIEGYPAPVRAVVIAKA